MITVERIQETMYVFRLSERALDEAIDDASALQAQLRAVRAAYANPVTANGNGAHAPATEPTKKSRAYTKQGGGEAPHAQGQKGAPAVPALRPYLCAPGQPRQPRQVFSPH